MHKIIKIACGLLFRRLDIVAYLTAENLAFRQQLLVLKRSQKRPKLRERDRLFWVTLFGLWSGLSQVIVGIAARDND